MNLKTKNPLLSNSLWQFIQIALRWILGFSLGALIARKMGPEIFGHYASLIALILVANAVASLGLQSIVVREFIEHKSPQNIFKTTFYLRLIGGVLSIIFLVLYSLLFNNTLELLYLLFPILIFQSADIWNCYFHSIQEVKKSAWASIFALLGISIFQGIAIYKNAELWVYLVIASSEYFLVAIGYYTLLKFKANPYLTKARFDKNIAKDLLKESWPILIASTAMLAHQRIDLGLLEWLGTPHETGLYAASSRLSNLYWAFPPLLFGTLYPMLIHFKKTSEDLFKSKLEDVVRNLQFMALVFSLILLFFGKELIILIYGKDFNGAENSLYYLGFSLIPYTLITLLDRLALIYRTPFSTLKNHSYTLILNLILGIILVPKYGAQGAALSTLISLCLSVTLLFYSDSLYKAHRNLFFNGIFKWIRFRNESLHHPFFIFGQKFKEHK